MAVTHKRLGKHGVLVSNLCLGTMNFGWHTSEEDSYKIMDRSLELGINFFDTADVYSRWVEEQDMDLSTARDAITVRDFGKLASIAEHNCLKMHSVMWASRPPVVYWNAATLACLESVRELQAGGVAAFFTIDAGPQVKVICLPGDQPRVVDALSNTGGVDNVLTSGIGAGAALVNRD